MRTPGNDFELAVGFCLSEQVCRQPDDIATVAYCLSGDGPQEYNVVTVTHPYGPVDLEAHHRNFVSNSSCGLCGKTTLDQVEADCAPIESPARDRPVGARRRYPTRCAPNRRCSRRPAASTRQPCFSSDGELLVLREDIGRHNALDKVIGWAALARRVPLSDAVFLVSGRVSFEIVQKAALAGIPVIGAVSAPSSLAVQTADRLGVTVVGFLRGRALQRVLTSRARRSVGMTATPDPEALLALFRRCGRRAS